MLPKTYVELGETLNPKFRVKLDYAKRRAYRLGKLTLDLADEINWNDYLHVLFKFHSDRWLKQGQDGVLPTGKVQHFFRAACNGLLTTNHLALFLLRLNAAPVAALCGFRTGNRFYYYIGAFDPDVHHLSPGSLILNEVLRYVIKNGFNQFDFLPGCEPYKYHWGAVNRQATYSLANELAQSRDSLDSGRRQPGRTGSTSAVLVRRLPNLRKKGGVCRIRKFSSCFRNGRKHQCKANTVELLRPSRAGSAAGTFL